MTYETLTVERDGAVAILALNRPDSRNALNLAMCEELVAALGALAADADVNAILLRANGPAFCAGADLKERQTMTASDVTARRVKGFAAYAAIERVPQPIVAVVHGPCFGSGCEIAAACDFVLATPAAQFRYPEVGWGTVGATQRLPRIAGPRIAKELLFTGRIFDAAEAQAIGLVNRLIAADAIEAEARALLAKIAAQAPLALRLTKRCIDAGLETTREGAMANELLAIEENLRASDWKKAIAGFGGSAAAKAGGAGGDA